MKALIISILLLSAPLAMAKVKCYSNSGRTQVNLYFDSEANLLDYRMGVESSNQSGSAEYMSEYLLSILGEEVASGVVASDDAEISHSYINLAEEDYELQIDLSYKAGWGHAGETVSVAKFRTDTAIMFNGKRLFQAHLDINFGESTPFLYHEGLFEESDNWGLTNNDPVGRKYTNIILNCTDDLKRNDQKQPGGPDEG